MPLWLVVNESRLAGTAHFSKGVIRLENDAGAILTIPEVNYKVLGNSRNQEDQSGALQRARSFVDSEADYTNLCMYIYILKQEVFTY